MTPTNGTAGRHREVEMPRVGPNFFVIGAQKAGTTRLCELLARHPDVAIPTKEPLYFQSPEEIARKRAWYEGLYEPVAGSPLRGDGSTYYSMVALYPRTAERLARFDPAARIVYLVRHPLRRIESGWVQLLSVGHANSFTGFARTLTETDLLLDPSMYWRQLCEYRRFFDDRQILVLFFEDLVADEAAVLGSCLAFLGADPAVRVDTSDTLGRNEGAAKRQRLPIVDAVRTLPGYERVKHRLPAGAKRLFSERVTRAARPPRWNDELLEWAIRQLADDSASLLEHCGRDPGFWPMS